MPKQALPPLLNSAAPRLGLVSLGCPKAIWDAEQPITRLSAEGYSLVPSYERADLVIFNTCGFIDSACTASLTASGEVLDETAG